MRNFKPVFAAVLFLFLAYWPVSFLQYCMKWDMMDWFFPMRFLIGECLQNHILPVWNPYTNLGYPLHIDPQSGALYPIVWIIGYLFGYSSYTINLEYFLHVLFAFYGMKKLGEQLGWHKNTAIIIGLTYACCGFFISNAQHLTYIISAAWVPYILYYYHRLYKNNYWKDAIGLSLFMFLLLTGGYPAFIITISYILLIIFLGIMINKIRNKHWKDAKIFLLNNVLFFITFVLQSLVFIVYFVQSLPYLVRTQKLTLENVLRVPFTPQSFISLLFPFATATDPKFYQTDLSMNNAYIGLTALVFIGALLWEKRSLKNLGLFFIAVFFLLVALGDYSFLRGWLYHYVPLMDLFRYPSLFRLFAMIVLLLLFGTGLNRWIEKGATKTLKRYLFNTIIICLALCLGFVIFAFANGTFIPLPDYTIKSIFHFIQQSSHTQLLLLQAPVQIIILLSLGWVIKNNKNKNSFRNILLIIGLDLFLSVQLNLFATVVCEKSTYQLQKELARLPDDFPIPADPLNTISQQGTGEIYPIWYNNNIFKKQIAHNGYNNFKLRQYSRFAVSSHCKGNIEKSNSFYWKPGTTRNL